MTGDVRNLDQLIESVTDLWSPHVVTRVNDWAVKVAKVRGEFVWHAHADTDELFIVLDGELEIDRRDADAPVRLGRNDVYVVPRGVEHRPRSAGGATIVMLEPADTLSTGDYAGDIPDHITSSTGLD